MWSVIGQTLFIVYILRTILKYFLFVFYIIYGFVVSYIKLPRVTKLWPISQNIVESSKEHTFKWMFKLTKKVLANYIACNGWCQIQTIKIESPL